MGRDVVCAKIDLLRSIVLYLEPPLDHDFWPHPPKPNMIHGEDLETTVILLFSISSGTGTTNLWLVLFKI